MSTVSRRTTVSVLAAFAALSSAAGQESHIGSDSGITVFTARDFRGTSVTFQHDVPVMKAVNFNDKIVSLKTGRGEQWEACEHENYQGRCVLVSGEEADLGRDRFAKMISSIRRVAAVRPTRPPSQPPAPAPWPPTDWYVVLFDQPNYKGRAVNYNTTLVSLSRAHTIRSVTIGRGIWQLCDEPSFSGRCLTLSASTPRLAGHSTQGFRVRSVRPVRPQRR